jgi:hypothetical protein
LRRLPLVVWLAMSLGAAASPPAAAQLSTPCELACGLVLGATGSVFATGAVVAVGRGSGGVTRIGQAATTFGVAFAAFVGSGIALGGNGARQERAAYAAGLGSVGGAVLGLAIGSAAAETDGARRLAATMIGAAAGALAGGVLGALTHDGDGGFQPATIGLRVTL